MKQLKVESTDTSRDDSPQEEIVLHTLFEEDQIKAMVKSLGSKISQDYDGKELVVVGVLKGASAFTSDLVREISMPILMDWVAVSTYGYGTKPGTPKLLKDVTLDIENKHLLLVDDILDTGATISWLIEHFAKRQPASIESCVLLRKASKSNQGIEPRYSGFEVFQDWFAGYGIDYKEKHRNLRNLNSIDLLPSQKKLCTDLDNDL